MQVDGQVVSQIGPGLCVLLGLLDGDTESDCEFMCVEVMRWQVK